MIAVDTNILVYAHREEYRKHVRAKAAILALASSSGPWGIPIFCLAEFVRVTTHRRIHNPPSPLELSVEFLDRLCALDNFRVLATDVEYWADLKAALEWADARGNLAFDAQIAAVCIRHGATLLTADRDFARFSIKTQAL